MSLRRPPLAFAVMPSRVVASILTAAGAARGRLVVDSREIGPGTVYLEEGRHRATALPHSAAMVLSLLPPEAFEPWVYGTRHHTRLFEFR